MHQYAYEVVLLATAIAAFTDLRNRSIPNWLTLPLLPLGLALNYWATRVPGLLFAALGIALCSLVPYILWRASAGKADGEKLIGGGDLKLFAGVGALVGPNAGLEVQLTSYVVVMIAALFLLTWRGLLWRTLLNSFRIIANWFLPQAKRSPIALESMVLMRVGPAAFVASVALYLVNSFGHG